MVGSLQDLKAFVLTQVDEEVAESTTWRSPSGGTWKFDNKVLSVTWQTKNQNIYFEGEIGKDVVKRINSFLNQGEADSAEDKVIDTEQIVELITQSSFQTSKQLNVQIDDITLENGDVMENHVGITATEYYEKSERNDGTKILSPCTNAISLDDEVSEHKGYYGPSTRETSVNHGQNKTFPSLVPTKFNDKPRETTTCNRFDILSHSNENNERLDAVIVDGSNEPTLPPVAKQKRADLSKQNEH